MTNEKKRVFYFEDEPELVFDYVRVLREKYEVIIGASLDLIERGQKSLDLVILDLMIHHFSFDEAGNEVPNISYPNVIWQRTAVEFLRRIRAGDYEKYGIPATIPVIVATALVDYKTREEVEQLDVKGYLEKPFSMDDLEDAVDAVFNGRRTNERP